MFKAPFSFDGRIRRIEYFLSGIIGGGISIWFIDRSCCYDCFHLVLFGTGGETSARLK